MKENDGATGLGIETGGRGGADANVNANGGGQETGMEGVTAGVS